MTRILLSAVFVLMIMPSLFSQNTIYSEGVVKKEDHPGNIISLKNGNTLYDFLLPYFAKVKINTSAIKIGETIVIHLGEKLDATGKIDRNPGGNIRYFVYTYVKENNAPINIYYPNVADKKHLRDNAIKVPESTGLVTPFRYVEIETKNSGLSKAISREIFHYRFNDNASSFSSSDSLLNAIWDISKHTIKATSFMGLYIDGDRERIPYEADALINQLSHYAVDSVYEVARNTIDHLMMHPTWPTEWHLQMHQVIWNDYIFTGNKKLIEKYYDLLKLKSLNSLTGKNELISTTAIPQTEAFLKSINYVHFDKKETLTDITDWPQRGNKVAGPDYVGESDGFVFCDYNSVVNSFHYKSILLMQKFAEILNKKEDAAYYKKRAATIKKSFKEIFIDAKTGLVKDGDTTQHSSFHANFFALDFGLIEDGQQKNKVLKFIESKGMACSVYGTQFLLDALYNEGAEDYALKLLTSKSERSWHHMLELGAGMTMEAWDLKFKPNLDWNHAWGAAPANAIAFNLMGIKPIEPAFKRIMIKPQIGSLKKAAITLPTPQGEIKEIIEQSNGKYIIQLSLPPNILADIMLPKNKGKLSFSGKHEKITETEQHYIIRNARGNCVARCE
jgi:alpha-L-rhamnosidase